MVDNKNKEIPREKLEQMHTQKDLDEVSDNLDKMFKNEEEDEENSQNLLELSNQLKLNMQMQMQMPSFNKDQQNIHKYGETPMNTQEVNINFFIYFSVMMIGRINSVNVLYQSSRFNKSNNL